MFKGQIMLFCHAKFFVAKFSGDYYLFLIEKETHFQKKKYLHQNVILTLMSERLKYVLRISKTSDKNGYTFVIQV